MWFLLLTLLEVILTVELYSCRGVWQLFLHFPHLACFPNFLNSVPSKHKQSTDCCQSQLLLGLVGKNMAFVAIVLSTLTHAVFIVTGLQCLFIYFSSKLGIEWNINHFAVRSYAVGAWPESASVSGRFRFRQGSLEDPFHLPLLWACVMCTNGLFHLYFSLLCCTFCPFWSDT